jgi:NAD(P)-dependent dehydrogenase (short-subunit alcohol dehydrogenase family)
MIENPLDLSGRTVLVTGASSGIGRECAVLLSSLNARLVIAGRDQSKLKDTLSSLTGTGHSIEAFDFAATDQIVDWVRKIAGQVGPLFGFVHSAGKQLVGPIRTLTPAAMEEQMRLNIFSSMMLARGFCQKGCGAKGGSLVFISSIMANVGKPGLSAYCASKAALVGLTRSLALELTRDKVRVNCIAPSIIETELTANLKELMLPEQWTALEEAHPLGFGTPRDVANAAAFLLADTGRWITGTALVVDGGFSAQ